MEDWKITDEENAVANLLGDAFNRFNKLPVIHSQDLPEFMRAIHIAQNIILARSAMRQNGFGILDDMRTLPPEMKERHGASHR